MITSLSQTTLHRFELASRHEWLETDGLGGYASGTVAGAHTRRYHGLLVAATRPPVGRAVLLSKLDEGIYTGDKYYELASNKYQGAVHPHGYIFQTEFELGMFPRFTYRVGEITLRKTIVALHEQPTVIVWYEVLNAPETFTLELLPLSAHRDYHALTHAHHVEQDAIQVKEDILSVQPNPALPAWQLALNGATFVEKRDWYYCFEYAEELGRGMAGHEDLFSPGKIYKQLSQGDSWGVMVSTDTPVGKDAKALIHEEVLRRERLLTQAKAHAPLQRQLALAADQFIVKRGTDLKTIIAGYHWFTDWGRDTMISLPGLCLYTGREADAKKILKAFAENVSEGMLPNRFPDGGEAPVYNNIDATLWFFVAAYKYYQHTGDLAFVKTELLPVMQEIIDCHQRGTRYGICMTDDGLLTGGEDGVQLTWMDALVGDWVVTPRRGKAVEVNALWYNAWKIFAMLTHAAGDVDQGIKLDEHAHQIAQSFIEAFWYEEGGYLFDVVSAEEKSTLLRPNQLFAISLPFTLLTHNQSQSVLYHVEKHLLTPYGMRSLAAMHEEYIGIYQGDQFNRDGAYHQGTVWSWLIGPFIDALIQVKGSWGKEQARQILQGFQQHMSEYGMGSISEIFDGDKPNIARGCIAQAWSIAELLRVIQEHQLLGKPQKAKVRNAGATSSQSAFKEMLPTS